MKFPALEHPPLPVLEGVGNEGLLRRRASVPDSREQNHGRRRQ